MISISNCFFCTDHEWPQQKASWPQEIMDLRCGLHHPVSMNISRYSTSFHLPFISFRIRIWNSQFYNSEYVWIMIEPLFYLYATFESHSTLAQRSGQNFRISQHNYTNMNNLIEQYLGIVNPLLTITNLQVDLDIPNLKAMYTTRWAVQRHRVKVC